MRGAGHVSFHACGGGRRRCRAGTGAGAGDAFGLYIAANSRIGGLRRGFQVSRERFLFVQIEIPAVDGLDIEA